MTVYDSVHIIFNPNSTGDSPAMARELADDLRKQLSSIDITLHETKYAGHAEEIAFQTSQEGETPLLVSVSGDGGYHEVVNGAMRAMHEKGANPLCLVAPGGNANDHYNSTSKRSYLEAIVEGSVTAFDLLKIEVNGKTRYAHSYMGLGLTPLVAIELNRHTLSAFREMKLAIRTFAKFRPFKIELEDKLTSFDSLVAANVNTMAKHLTVSDQNLPLDGKFDVMTWPHSSKLALLWKLLRLAVGTSPNVTKRESLRFVCVKPMPMQLDGEVVELKQGDTVLVRALQQKLRTLR